MEWQPIETAPKNEVILLYGEIDPHPDDEQLHSKGARRVAGYWDQIDEAWSSTTSTWAGPWIKPTHWMPLPPPPDVFLDFSGVNNAADWLGQFMDARPTNNKRVATPKDDGLVHKEG